MRLGCRRCRRAGRSAAGCPVFHQSRHGSAGRRRWDDREYGLRALLRLGARHRHRVSGLGALNQNRNIKFHAFQSIFMHLALIVTYIALTILSLMLHTIPVIGALLGLLVSLALGLGSFLLWLFMLFKTYNGEKIMLPVIGELAQKQANQ